MGQRYFAIPASGSIRFAMASNSIGCQRLDRGPLRRSIGMSALSSVFLMEFSLMAKVRKTKSGTYSLMVSFCRRRCNLTLGKICESKAHAFSTSVSALIQHRKHGGRLPISPVLDAWIQTLSARHRRQLSKIGLLSDGDFDLTVGELIEKFLRDYCRRPLAESSKISFSSAMKHRIAPSLKSKKLSEIEPEKASYRVNAEPTFSESTEELFKSAEAWQRKHYAFAAKPPRI